jgi:hypothetical protein
MYTQVWLSGESLRIMWPFCGLKLTSHGLHSHYSSLSVSINFQAKPILNATDLPFQLSEILQGKVLTRYYFRYAAH